MNESFFCVCVRVCVLPHGTLFESLKDYWLGDDGVSKSGLKYEHFELTRPWSTLWSNPLRSSRMHLQWNLPIVGLCQFAGYHRGVSHFRLHSHHAAIDRSFSVRVGQPKAFCSVTTLNSIVANCPYFGGTVLPLKRFQAIVPLAGLARPPKN